MREALQCAIQPREPRAPRASLGDGSHGRADLHAVQIGQHRTLVCWPFSQRDRVVRVSFQCPHNARHGRNRWGLGDLVDRGNLELDDPHRLGWLTT